MTALFVTATGTDIGKTFVSAGLIAHYRAAGSSIDAIKPVVSGFDPQTWDRGPEASDPAVLLAALGRPVTPAEVERIAPWRFKAPLSPDQAAAQEGRAIVFQEVVEFCREAIAAHRGTLLIEGIGGIMVPLDDRRTVLDLMSVLRIPIVLVAGSYVGTISHSLTALEVLARRNINVAAVAVSESAASAATLSDTVKALQHFGGGTDIVGIPRRTPDNDLAPAFAQLAALL